MEALTRLVSESFARHGFDRPIDYRRLKWSRWFRCESHHSLLFVPSKPGVFALAEEVGSAPAQGTADTDPCQAVLRRELDNEVFGAQGRHMLAVTQFFEADDMAFILDRMLSRYNPMRARLESGRYFVRFVVIEDESQRHNIHAALNQWIHSSAEKTTDVGGQIATSLELTHEHVVVADSSQANLFSSAEMGRVIFSAHVATAASAVPRTLSEAKGSGTLLPTDATEPTVSPTDPRQSFADAKIQLPPAFPSGF